MRLTTFTLNHAYKSRKLFLRKIGILWFATVLQPDRESPNSIDNRE